MFFIEARARRKQIKQLEGEISDIYDGWRDEIQLGHGNPAASEAFEPSRRLVRLVEEPLRAKGDRMGIDLLPDGRK